MTSTTTSLRIALRLALLGVTAAASTNVAVLELGEPEQLIEIQVMAVVD